MENITRRLFLRNTAAAGAVGATTTAAPAVAETFSTVEDRALHHWHEFQAAIREMLPDDCRFQVFGGVHGFRAEALCKEQDEVRPGVFITIERIDCAAHYIDGQGWIERGRV